MLYLSQEEIPNSNSWQALAKDFSLLMLAHLLGLPPWNESLLLRLLFDDWLQN